MSNETPEQITPEKDILETLREMGAEKPVLATEEPIKPPVETPAEVAVDPNEVKPPEVVPAETPAPADLLDIPEVKPVVNVEAEYNALKLWKESIEKKPSLLGLLELAASGVDVSELLVVSGGTDPNQLGADSLYAAQLKRDYPTLTDDQIKAKTQRFMDDFNGDSNDDTDREIILADLRRKFPKEDISSKVHEKIQALVDENKQANAEATQFTQKIRTDYDTWAATAVGNSIRGHIVTKEDIDYARSFMFGENPHIMKEGDRVTGYNGAKHAIEIIAAKNIDSIIKTKVEQALEANNAEWKEKELKWNNDRKVITPAPGGTIIPGTQQQGTKDEAETAFNNFITNE